MASPICTIERLPVLPVGTLNGLYQGQATFSGSREKGSTLGERQGEQADTGIATAHLLHSTSKAPAANTVLQGGMPIKGAPCCQMLPKSHIHEPDPKFPQTGCGPWTEDCQPLACIISDQLGWNRGLRVNKEKRKSGNR